MVFHCLLAPTIALSLTEDFLFIFGILKFHEMCFFFILLSNLRTILCLLLCKCFPLNLSSLLFPSCLWTFPKPQLYSYRTGPHPSPAYHLIYRSPTSAPIFSFIPPIVTRKMILFLLQVRPFPHTLDPLPVPPQGPAPPAFSPVLISFT